MQPNKFEDEIMKGSTSAGKKFALIGGVLVTLFVFTVLMIHHFAQQLPTEEQRTIRLWSDQTASFWTVDPNVYVDGKKLRDTRPQTDDLTSNSVENPYQQVIPHRPKHHTTRNKKTNTQTLDEAAKGQPPPPPSSSFVRLLDDLRETGNRFRKNELTPEQTDTVVLLKVQNWAQVRGVRSRRYGRNVYKFLSVPYAKPPLGELRFAEPAVFKPSSADQVIDCTEFGAICPQFFDEVLVKTVNPLSLNMSEDCLTLNIWTPSLPGKAEEDSVDHRQRMSTKQKKASMSGTHWTMLSKETLDFEDDPINNKSTNAFEGQTEQMTTQPSTTTTAAAYWLKQETTKFIPIRT